MAMDSNEPHEPPHVHEPDPAEEIDVDLGDEVVALADEQELEAAALARATVPEGVECMGEYPSLEAYLQSQLEPEISPGCAWLLDCLDYQAVLERFQADGSRYFCEHGHVYRIGGT